jgi:hypothetical protein
MIFLVLVLFAICGADKLTEYSCGGNVAALSKSRQPRVSVVVCWREGAMIGPRALREILEHDQDYAFEVIYVHVDLALWRDVLKSACALQREFGHERLRIVTTTPHAMPDKFAMFRLGGTFARSRYVLFSENNSLGFDDKQVAQLVAAMTSTRPTPSVLTSVVRAIQDGEIHDHHPAMRIVLKATSNGWVLEWSGFSGREDASENQAHTHFVNSANFTVRAADLVEPHTFLIDTETTSLAGAFDSASHVSVMFGLAAWRSSGIQPAIAANVKTNYLYPQEDLHLLDLPIVITIWAAYEALASVAYLEKRWRVIYRNQCGQSWHTAVALNGKRFARHQWPDLERPATGVIVSALYFFALHVTHLTCHVTWRNGTRTVFENTATELLLSLSALTDDIDANRIDAIDAYPAQRHIPVPALRAEHDGDAEWLRDVVVSQPTQSFISSTAPDCSHCLFRPILARLTLLTVRTSYDDALVQKIGELVDASFLVQSDSEHRYVYFMVKGRQSAAVDRAIASLDERLVAAQLGRLERVRIKMPKAIGGKWSRFNFETLASDESDVIPLFRRSLQVDWIGLPHRGRSRVRDQIEHFYLENSIDDTKLAG